MIHHAMQRVVFRLDLVELQCSPRKAPVASAQGFPRRSVRPRSFSRQKPLCEPRLSYLHCTPYTDIGVDFCIHTHNPITRPAQFRRRSHPSTHSSSASATTTVTSS
jgi:hypothetical protein